MYVKSLDMSLQGCAIREVEDKWGISGVPLCKYKYQPFRKQGKKGQEEELVKAYGCHLHHETRRRKIEKYGPRRGWVDFDHWHLAGPVTATATAITAECMEGKSGNKFL